MLIYQNSSPARTLSFSLAKSFYLNFSIVHLCHLRASPEVSEGTARMLGLEFFLHTHWNINQAHPWSNLKKFSDPLLETLSSRSLLGQGESVTSRGPLKQVLQERPALPQCLGLSAANRGRETGRCANSFCYIHSEEGSKAKPSQLNWDFGERNFFKNQKYFHILSGFWL